MMKLNSALKIILYLLSITFLTVVGGDIIRLTLRDFEHVLNPTRRSFVHAKRAITYAKSMHERKLTVAMSGRMKRLTKSVK